MREPLFVPRRIGGKRRVGLPQVLTGPARIEPEQEVYVWPCRNRAGVLMISRSAPSGSAHGRPMWTRKVSSSRQLALPAASLDAAGLRTGQWVYVAAGADGTRLRVLPKENVAAVRSQDLRSGLTRGEVEG